MEGAINNNAVDEEKVYKIIDKVRRETRLSYKLATHAVYVVLENLAVLTPSPLTSLIDGILKEFEVPLDVSNSLLDSTEDMTRLISISDNLDSVKNDAQQRSWELFDDQASIMECLNELKSILTDADNSVVRRFFQITDYSIVSCLAEYYQMESRWPIKIIVLEICDLLCILSRTAVRILLGSILPLELTRDIQINHKDKEKLSACVRVMVKLFAIGDPCPIIYYDSMDKDFILFLLNLIETASNDSSDDDDVTELIHFILVYNLQFKNCPESENITIKALEEAENPKIFSETLLFLFNRKNDPVRILDHQPYPSNSFLKMITDIFSSDKAFDVFYKNDVLVLIDIVLRQLTDDSPSIEESIQWLELLKQILVKTDPYVYRSHIDDTQSRISRISNVIDDTNQKAKQLILEIMDFLSSCLESG